MIGALRWTASSTALALSMVGLAIGYVLRGREWLRDKRLEVYTEFLESSRRCSLAVADCRAHHPFELEARFNVAWIQSQSAEKRSSEETSHVERLKRVEARTEELGTVAGDRLEDFFVQQYSLRMIATPGVARAGAIVRLRLLALSPATADRRVKQDDWNQLVGALHNAQGEFLGCAMRDVQGRVSLWWRRRVLKGDFRDIVDPDSRSPSGHPPDV